MVNNPHLLEGEGEPTSRSGGCVEIHPGQGQAAFPISASGVVPGSLLEILKLPSWVVEILHSLFLSLLMRLLLWVGFLMRK